MTWLDDTALVCAANEGSHFTPEIYNHRPDIIKKFEANAFSYLSHL
jgi:hypothetical protein